MKDKILSVVGSTSVSESSDRDVLAEIDAEVKSHPLVLYMKGTPAQPLCGFSQRAVALLKSYNQEFLAVNVLEDEGKRQGIKTYSDWPTIPQIYVNGTFLGGSDILIDLHEKGKLEGFLPAKG
jgi:monothiol glutaredoxin